LILPKILYHPHKRLLHVIVGIIAEEIGTRNPTRKRESNVPNQLDGHEGRDMSIWNA
jgi:hypothetical protein